jgi:hypothetical protein
VSIRQAGGGETVDRMSRHTETPSPPGQPYVEDCHVGTKRRNAGHGPRSRIRLADDLDVVLALEQLRDAPPDDLMVVEQEHGDAHGLGLLSVLR